MGSSPLAEMWHPAVPAPARSIAHPERGQSEKILMNKQRIRRLETKVQQLDTAEKPAPRRLHTAQDVIDLLHEQVEMLRAQRGAGSVQRARAIGYLAGIARKAIETSTLAARLEMLEAVLRKRKENDLP